jgi:Zn-dependent protease
VGLAIFRGVIGIGLVIALIVLVPSVVLHEVSHGFVAYLFGDDTAKRAKRLTLNPLRHIDPFGSVILPAVLVLVGVPPIGYAKPVPVNVSRLRHPRNQAVLVALAGPLVNIALSVVGGIVLHFLISGELASGASPNLVGNSIVDQALFYFGEVNLLLAVFNLIPIPPLDGSAVLERLMPQQMWERFLSFRMYFLILVFAVAVLFPNVLATVFSPFESWWTHSFLTFGSVGV